MGRWPSFSHLLSIFLPSLRAAPMEGVNQLDESFSLARGGKRSGKAGSTATGGAFAAKVWKLSAGAQAFVSPLAQAPTGSVDARRGSIWKRATWGEAMGEGEAEGSAARPG
jgi:hypothetical protein